MTVTLSDKLVYESVATLPSPILVTGASGQVGGALLGLLGEKAVALNSQDLNLAEPDSIIAVLERIQPAVILNPAAYTAVDRAEEEEALATTINGKAPGVMARWCARQCIPFVHYSTDYVFNGQGDTPWREEDATAPLNAYGRSKLAGEQAVQEAGGNYLIFRTSWVYDASGKNFLNTMLRVGATHKKLTVVSDQYGAPTYAPHLAAATLQALAYAIGQARFPSGIYHCCNSGETSWHGFAEAIFSEARGAGFPLAVTQVEPVPSSAYPTPAKRPANSRMAMQKLESIFGLRMPDWQEGVKEAVGEKSQAKTAISA